MIFIAIINGTIREWYKKYTGELSARQISTVSLIILLGIYIFFVIKKYPPQSPIQSLIIGLFWVVLTLGFEFGFGLYRGNSWSTLLDDYNIMKGNLWILVPICILVSPYIFFKMQN
ncbi:hypothetical protein [Flavobacterium sp. GT2N3]|uniref:hypothetical protein n=1 Tax=unclassified Flavobacterium TaxID=196869 RepID=UPI003AAA6B49